MLPRQSFSPINQINMRSALEDLEELYQILKNWKVKNPGAFRLDGHYSIGPANPAQWIFFKVNGMTSDSYSGTEMGKLIDGTKWNGMYYLTASTRMEAVNEFLSLFEKHKGDATKIFTPSYTENKQGLPSKRKLYLKDVRGNINDGWFCKQYYNRFNPN